MPAASRRSDHREFHYGGGEADGLSDQFIEDVILNAPKRANSGLEMQPRPKAEDAARHEEWASGIYSKRYEEEEARRKQCTCGSAWVGIFSVLLLLLGITAFVVGIVDEHGKQILPLCPGCTKFHTGIYVAGGVLVLLSLLGAVAAKTRNPVAAAPFAFLILIVGLGFLCLGFIVVFYATGVVTLDILPLWEDSVQGDPQLICSIQGSLRCSGFQLGCCYSQFSIGTNAPTTSAPPTPSPTGAPGANHSTSGRALRVQSALGGSSGSDAYCWILTDEGLQPDWVSQVCSPLCSDSNAFTTTCDAALQRSIKEFLAPITGVLFPLGVIMILTGIAAIRMSCCK